MSRQAELRDGSVVEIRAIEPDDADGLVAGFGALSDRSRYERFLTAVPRLPRHWVDELVDVDHRDREALVAIDPLAGEGIGVARYARVAGADGEVEFAVTVVDVWHGRGLGRVLLEELFAAARANGLTCASGDVLAENAPMLALARRFHARVEPQRAGVVHVVIAL